jgi:hypothetical protein
MIIHTRSSLSSKAYDHYELFLGSRQGRALVYDPPNPIEPVEFWTMAPRWDGSGLLVSNKPINLNAVFISSRLRFAGYAGITAGFVLIARWGHRRLSGLHPMMFRKQKIILSICQCAVLVVASAFIAVIYHSVNDEGLLLRKQSTEAIRLAYQPKHSNPDKSGQKANNNK